MLIPLKLVRDQQLQQQIFDQLRDLIVSNRLQPGSRMPSSRMMAEQFAISRMTVLLTYERLIAEGYLETRPAAGTFVAQPAADPMSHLSVNASPEASALALAHPPAGPEFTASSHLARQSTPREPSGSAHRELASRPGGADPSLFPAQRWRSLMRQGLDRLGSLSGSEHSAGSPPLRDAIASWLSTSRGLAVSPDQVMLVNSRQQALHVAAHLASHACEGRRTMVRTADRVPDQCPMERPAGEPRTGVRTLRPVAAADNRLVRIVTEDPCDADAAAALAGEGAVLVRVPVDADGLHTDSLPDGDALLVHVTPEHQRPLGAVLSRDRRIALLQWAARAGALILEEDIVGEVRYGHMNVPPLMSLDRSERVILLGGFGVSLGPWLDTAYMVMPRWLLPFGLATRQLIDDSRSTLEHSALAEFLGGGGYARHLHRLTKAYASRRDALVAALRRHIDGPAEIWGHQAGLHLTWFPPALLGSAANLTALARLCGLDATAPREDVILLGFGTLDERHLELGVRRMAEALTTATNGSEPIVRMAAAFVRPLAHGAVN